MYSVRGGLALIALLILSLEFVSLFFTLTFLQRQDNNKVDAELDYLSHRISRSIVIQLNTTNFNLRQYSATTRVHGIYMTAEAFTDILQVDYNPQFFTVQSYVFVAAIENSQRQQFEDFCSARIEDNCTIKDVTGTNEFSPAPVRTRYYAVMFLHPSPYKPSLIGLDISVPPLQPLFREIQEAVKLNSSIISRKVDLAGQDPENSNSFGVVMSHPVFRNASDSTSPVVGFHAAIIRLRDVIHQGFVRVTLSRSEASVLVIDKTNNTELLTDRLLYRENIPEFSGIEDITKYDVKTIVYVENRVWHIYYLYSTQYKDMQRSSQPLLITLAETILFVLMNILLISLVFVSKYWARAQSYAKVNERTNSMLAFVNHEIRNPLNVIQNFVLFSIDNLENNSDRKVETAITDLQIVASHCEFLEHIVSDILVIQKLEAGKLELDLQLCSVESIMRDLSNATLQKREENRQVEISFVYDPDIVVFVDAFRLKQCLLNYLSNAMKYTTKGSIKLTSVQDDSSTTFTVADTGQGIDEVNYPKIFKAFTHVNATDAARHGSHGLGLYLVKMLADCMGATVGFTSSSKGSVFWINVKT